MAGQGQSATDFSDAMAVLKRDRDRFVTLAFAAADVLLELDTDDRIVFAAGASQSLVGKSPEALVGQPFLQLVAPEDAPLIEEVLQSMANGGRLDPVPLTLLGPFGPTVPLSLMGYHLTDLSGSKYLAIRLGSPVAATDTLTDAVRDPESGLLEKEDFAEFASKQIREAGERGETLKLTMIHTGDLSDLRSRLDAEHAENAFRRMGNCLQANSAGGQAAGVLADDAYGFLHKAGVDVKKITTRVEEIFKAADPTGAGISVQTGTVDADVGTMSEADSVRVLLYTVSQFCEFGPDKFEMASLADTLKVMTRETTEKLTKFRILTEKARFDLAFQPIVALDSYAIHHFEVLARFGKKLDRSPYELITFAENTGVISEFDLAMAGRALEWLTAQNKTGARHVIAVNLSGNSIANTGFVTALHELLRKFDKIRSQLVFEITESAKIDKLEEANRFIQGLRKKGHQVCLDDFGAGAAALHYLHALDVDVVKIDGKYVRTAIGQPRNQAFLRSIAYLCRDLGIETIAEMVEDEPCATMLRGCQVRFGQGYFFGKPAFEVDGFASALKKVPRPAIEPVRQGPISSDVAEVISPDRMFKAKRSGNLH